MNATPPYRAILTASATLVVGWALGFLMAGSPEQGKASSSGPHAAASERGSPSGARRDTVQPWADSGAASGAISLDGLGIAPGDASAHFESLMRGALRLTDQTDRMVRLREIARAIPVSELPAAVEKAKRLPSSESWLVMQALGARWAEVAPVAAAEYSLKNGGNRYGWNQLLAGVIEKWASADHHGAVTWIGNQPEGRRARLMQSLVQSVARMDPEAAFQILKSQPDTGQMNWLQGQVFEQWSRRDPAGAAKAAESLPPGGAREGAMKSAAASWAVQDAPAAIAWARTFADKNNQNKMLTAVAQAWAEHEPNAVIEWAGTVEEPMVRQQILTAAFSQLAQSDPEAARGQLRAMAAGQERDNLVTQVAYAAANQDAKAALEFVDLLPAGQSRVALTGNLVSRLAHTNPKAAAEIFATLPQSQLSYQTNQFASAIASADMDFAREWVDQLSEPQAKTQAVRAVAGVLARGDPREAAEWLVEKQPGADLGWLLNSWVRNAPGDVLSWAKALPEGEAKRSAQSAVVHALTNVDVQQARKIFTEELSPEARVSTAGQLATQWASRDVSAARAWAEKLPPGGARENALGGIASAWAQQDAGAAAQWLEKFAPGDERDRVVTQFAGAVLQRDPATALAWVATVGDPDLRGAQVEQLASRWLQTDSGAARAWISNSEHLTPSARRRVLEQRSQSYYNPYNNYFQ